MKAHLIVRSTVPAVADRAPFDAWYQDDHMAAVIREYRPLRCWRSWSTLEPEIHYAFYEFETADRLKQVMETQSFADLVDDFSTTWAGKVTRTRDITITSRIHER